MLNCNNSELYLVCVQCALAVLFHIKRYVPKEWQGVARTLLGVCEVALGFSVCNMN